MKVIIAISALFLTLPASATAPIVNDPIATQAINKLAAEAASGRLDEKAEKAMDRAIKAANFGLTLNNYAKILEGMNKQFKSMTGVRDVGDILVDMQKLKNKFLQDQMDNFDLNKMLNPQSGEGSVAVNQMLEKYQLYAMCAGMTLIATVDCKQKVANKASALSTADSIAKKLDATLKSAEQLAARAGRTSDQKESLDLNNAIGIKNIELAALQTQWDINIQQHQARDKLLEEKAKASFLNQQSEAPALTFK